MGHEWSCPAARSDDAVRALLRLGGGARGKRVLVNFVGPVFEFFGVAVTAAADIDPPEYATPAKGSAKP